MKRGKSTTQEWTVSLHEVEKAIATFPEASSPSVTAHLFAKGFSHTKMTKIAACKPQNRDSCVTPLSTKTPTHAITADCDLHGSKAARESRCRPRHPRMTAFRRVGVSRDQTLLDEMDLK